MAQTKKKTTKKKTVNKPFDPATITTVAKVKALSMPQLAKLYGVARSTIANWKTSVDVYNPVDVGMHVLAGEGRTQVKIDIVKTCNNILKQIGLDPIAEVIIQNALADEMARAKLDKAKEEANLARLKRQKLESELVEVSQVIELVGNSFAKIKALIERMTTDLPNELEGLSAPEIEKRLSDRVKGTLAEASDSISKQFTAS